MTQDTMMTPKEIATILRVTEKTVLREIARGKIPGHKIGKQWRVYKSKFEQYIKDAHLKSRGENA